MAVATPTDAGARAAGEWLARVRREAGLTQQELAQRLGVSLWTIDRYERGELSFDAQRELIAAATGQPAPVLSLAPPPDVTAPPEPEAPPAAADRRAWVVLAPLVVLVCIRFFSEKVGILPKAVTFIDVPIFIGLVTAAVFAHNPRAARERTEPGFAAVGVLLFIWTIAATLANLDRVALPPVLLFVYGFLAPVLVFYAVHALWPVGRPRTLTRTLVVLAAIQVLIGFTIDFPRLLSTNDADVMSGTFGENGYQMVIFLVVVLAVVAGSIAWDRGSMPARVGPVLVALVTILIFLVQYRAILPILVVTLAVLGGALGAGRARGVVSFAALATLFVVVLTWLASALPFLKYEGAVRTIASEPATLVTARMGLVTDVTDLYAEKPQSIVLGTGPATFSSRAWRTFADTKMTRTAVAGSYAEQLLGGAYRTDVGEKYTMTRYRSAAIIEGSRAASLPFASYTAVAAELGMPGLLLLVTLYALAFLHAWRLCRRAVRSRLPSDAVAPIALGALTAFCMLIQAAVLENWLEVTRMTFLAWALLAVATKELAQRASP